MPFAFFYSIAGAVVAGIVQFFASKAGTILAGLGVTYVSVKGFQTVAGYIINDMQLIASSLSGAGGAGGSSLAAVMLQIAAYAGLFDALNIIISGYMAGASLMMMRVFLTRLK